MNVPVAHRARSLSISDLSTAYRERRTTPLALVEELFTRIAAAEPGIWITRLPQHSLECARRLAGQDPASLPLYGIPFAIKDNIDLANVPTTVACPAFAYTPAESAYVVTRLIDAGAIFIGKTNLDQFATGLTGTRSPYGVPRNPFAPPMVPGRSIPGSAFLVAKGLVSYQVGTDSAGSGRRPAAFNNLFGLKPTLGLISRRGL